MMSILLTLVLLKRSDGQYYRVHVGHIGQRGLIFDTIAASFNDFEFTVHPVVIAVRISSSSEAEANARIAVDEAIQTMPHRNGWFKSDLNSAASILYKTLDLQALGLESEALAFDLKPEPVEPGQTAMVAEVKSQIWKHLEPCTTQDEYTAAEIRKDLIQKLGKVEAKMILDSCVTTVAKTNKGNKSRLLKADGKLLKLKPTSF